MPIGAIACALLAAIAAIGCAGPAYPDRGARASESVAPGAVPAGATVDAATEDRILALVPEHISRQDVEQTLALGPAPRIIAVQGSLPFVTMKPFAQFLIAMGYPASRIRNPRDGSYSYSGYSDSTELAGSLAWYYEREGMMPILIGHSRGGMVVIKVLHELAGEFGDKILVWNPLTGEAENRITIRDPITGAERPVVGLKVGYAAAIATGKLPRMLLGEWTMLPRLRKIPDTVEEFTGFFIEWDLIAGTLGGAEPYQPEGSAAVRNVTLPAAYSHIAIPMTEHLAVHGATRNWISEYVPGEPPPAFPANLNVDATNILHAAELWYSIKKHWCQEAQSLIRAKRARVAAGG